MRQDYSNLPDRLPVPEDDGAADHLPGLDIPSIQLPRTDGSSVDLARLVGLWVLYVYPMTGRPGVPLPDGWDDIPGARGCTPQSCAFRDHHAELKAVGAGVLGLSTQNSEYQREARDSLHLPFELVSDRDRQLQQALGLPTFEAGGMTLFKRLTMIASDGRIEKVFYPVFPPDRNAGDVLSWLRAHAHRG